MEAIARKYGIRSTNSIRRRISAQAWKRDYEAIANYLATRTFADIPPAKTPPELRQPTAQVVRNKICQHIRNIESVKPSHPSSHRTLPPGSQSAARPRVIDDACRDHRSTATVGSDAYEPVTTTASSLAHLKADLVNRQITCSEEILQTGLLTLKIISEHLSADFNDSHACKLAARRLIGINSTRETLAGLLTAGAALVKAGTAMKRQALELNGVNLSPDHEAGNTAPIVPIRGAGVRLLEHLSLDALRNMRAVVLEVSRLPPGTLDPI